LLRLFLVHEQGGYSAFADNRRRRIRT
jgi:hypothetical protein